LKTIFKCIDWFLESLYDGFIEWAKYLILGIGGFLLTILMWRSEGSMGKTIVIIMVVFIVGKAIVKTHSKYLHEKTKHQKDKIILEHMEKQIKRIDRLNDNLGKTAVRFQKYLDDSKEGDVK
jgi:hypothetical protein